MSTNNKIENKPNLDYYTNNPSYSIMTCNDPQVI